MISRVALEAVGKQWLLRLAGENAVFDILTDSPSLARARALVEASDPTFAEVTLGVFGQFPVTVCRTATGEVAIALDGPDLGPEVRGNQAVVFYPTLSKAIELFRLDSDVSAT